MSFCRVLKFNWHEKLQCEPLLWPLPISLVGFFLWFYVQFHNRFFWYIHCTVHTLWRLQTILWLLIICRFENLKFWKKNLHSGSENAKGQIFIWAVPAVKEDTIFGAPQTKFVRALILRQNWINYIKLLFERILMK